MARGPSRRPSPRVAINRSGQELVVDRNSRPFHPVDRRMQSAVASVQHPGCSLGSYQKPPSLCPVAGKGGTYSTTDDLEAPVARPKAHVALDRVASPKSPIVGTQRDDLRMLPMSLANTSIRQSP